MSTEPKKKKWKKSRNFVHFSSNSIELFIIKMFFIRKNRGGWSGSAINPFELYANIFHFLRTQVSWDARFSFHLPGRQILRAEPKNRSWFNGGGKRLWHIIMKQYAQLDAWTRNHSSADKSRKWKFIKSLICCAKQLL